MARDFELLMADDSTSNTTNCIAQYQAAGMEAGVHSRPIHIPRRLPMQKGRS